MKITITLEIREHYQISLAAFLENTTQAKNKRWTNPFRQKSECPGCYAFYVEDECLYIGRSKNSATQRVLHHFRSSWSQHDIDRILREFPDSDIQVTFWLCGREDVEILEYHLIQTLKPSLNSKGREGGRVLNLTFENLYNKETNMKRHESQARALAGESIAKI